MDPEMGAAFSTWGMVLMMILIFYFLLYRPQKNAQKRHTEMLDQLKTGDKVVTIGGIYGTISGMEENVIKLKVADNVEIEMVRSAINKNVSQESGE